MRKTIALVTIPESAGSGLYRGIESFLALLVWLLAAYFFCKCLMSREIRLYKDRIVQVWWLLGSYELLLRNASLSFLPGHRGKIRSLSDPGLSRFRRLFQEIIYYDLLANPEDVKRLSGQLADLSGRKLEEFEQHSVIMDRLIREENE
jgi:hypothetical protein